MSGSGRETGRARVLSMLLATTGAARDEAESMRLLATGVPALVPAGLSGVALRGDDGWETVLQQEGGLPGGPDLSAPEFDELLAAGTARDGPVLRDEAIPRRIRGLGIRQLAFVPIRTLEGTLGLLIAGRSAGTISDDDVALLQTLADHTAMSIENDRLHRNLEALVEKRTTHLRLLLEANNALVGNLRRESLLHAVTDTLRAAMPFDRASIVFLDHERDVLVVGAVAGPAGTELRIPAGVEMPRSTSHLRAVVDERRPVRCADLASKRRTPEEDRLLEEGLRSYVAVPLIAKGQVIGTLNVGRAGTAMSEDDVELLSEIASQVALAVDNMLAYEEIGRLKARLEMENRALQEEIQTRRSDVILGESPAIRKVLEQIELVAPTDAGVLVLGESGTGKELVAREIHRQSARCDGPLVKVNCASIPRELYESEFFGHAKGAFTGATRDRAGRFELADGGTLFLDEVGEIPLDLQSKLLRVLQEGQFERVGVARARRRRPDRRRHEPRPRARHRGEAIPRGPLLPAQRVPDRAGPPAQAEAGHPDPRGALPPHGVQAHEPFAGGPRRRGTEAARGLRMARKRP